MTTQRAFNRSLTENHPFGCSYVSLMEFAVSRELASGGN